MDCRHFKRITVKGHDLRTDILDNVKLLQKVGAQAEKVYGKSLPVNATGAIGAIARVM